MAFGVSEFAIAVFVDIRGFSSFSERTEAPNTAMFIKRVYMRLMDNYFSDAAFCKPTGDGLMMIFSYDENTLLQTSATVVSAAVRAVSEFSKICENDPMINFTVPQKIGIGIARGTACKLSAGGRVLDYSGRILNLSARLTSIARPEGVVIDGEFYESMIPESERSRFRSSEVYVRGIAEVSPRAVFLLDSVSGVPSENLQPMHNPAWKEIKESFSLKTFAQAGPKYVVDLNAVPDPKYFSVIVTHPARSGGRMVTGVVTEMVLEPNKHCSLTHHGGIWQVAIDIAVILANLKEKGLPQKSTIQLKVRFVVAKP
jgi:class 3 adenylate cyclase